MLSIWMAFVPVSVLALLLCAKFYLDCARLKGENVRLKNSLEGMKKVHEETNKVIIKRLQEQLVK